MELLKKLLDKKASEDNTICLNAYAQGIIDSKAPEMLEMLNHVKGYLGSDQRELVEQLINEATNV